MRSETRCERKRGKPRGKREQNPNLRRPRQPDLPKSLTGRERILRRPPRRRRETPDIQQAKAPSRRGRKQRRPWTRGHLLLHHYHRVEALQSMIEFIVYTIVLYTTVVYADPGLDAGIQER